MTRGEVPVRLAITVGDPAGIGPEVAMKAVRALAAGDRAGLELHFVGDRASFSNEGFDDRDGTLHQTVAFDVAAHGIGRPTAASGETAVAALLHAIGLARAGTVDGVVTAPLSKQGMALAGHLYSGQTEILVEQGRVDRGVMLFVGGGLRVAIATRHLALADVPSSLSADTVCADLLLMHRALLRDFGVDHPRIAVCGLNPHAGEAGLFGDEETSILGPAIQAAREEGVEASDPLPADTAFVRARKGEFDATLAMYHDQGLIPVKLLSFGGGVNVTLGLPFVRTSPDHGTAYDIAGRGWADASSMLEAVRLAAELVRNRRRSS